MKVITPTALCNTGWKNTGDMIGHCEIWYRGGTVIYYNRHSQRIEQSFKPKMKEK